MVTTKDCYYPPSERGDYVLELITRDLHNNSSVCKWATCCVFTVASMWPGHCRLWKHIINIYLSHCLYFVFFCSGLQCFDAQLMPLPLTASCFSKIQIGFAFLVPAHPGSPRKRAIKWVCVCVLIFCFVLLEWCSLGLVTLGLGLVSWVPSTALSLWKEPLRQN